VRPVHGQRTLERMIEALRRQCRRNTYCVVAAIIIAAIAPVGAAMAGDPPVPAGTDPGGIPVAWIGEGLDYTSSEFAVRLARDGEGTIIGWDAIDGDALPFARDAKQQRALQALLAEGQAATLIAIRSNEDAATLVAAISYAVKTPSRLIVVAPVIASQADRVGEVVESASRRFADHVFVVPARLSAEKPGAARPNLAAALANVIRVAPAGSTLPRDAADVYAAAPLATSGDGEAAASGALARVVAIAARLRAVEPQLSARAMKERIVRLATPDPDGRLVIADPKRHFWLE
jgi:hypothetical protein